jgi:hypothetical protein
MIWDGLNFFGYDDSKISRLYGTPIKFTDKFFMKKLIASVLLSIAVITNVIVDETSKIG